MDIFKLLVITLIMGTTLFAQTSQSNSEAVDSTSSNYIYVQRKTSQNFTMGTNGAPGFYNLTSLEFKVGEKGTFRGIGFMGSNIEPYLKKDPQAYREFNKYKSRQKLRYTFWGISLVSGIIGAVTVNKSTGETSYDPMENKMVEKKEIRPFGAVLIGVSMVSFLTGIIVGNNSRDHVTDAINIYNDNLSKKMTSELRMDIRPELNGNQIGLAFCLNW